MIYMIAEPSLRMGVSYLAAFGQTMAVPIPGAKFHAN